MNGKRRNKGGINVTFERNLGRQRFCGENTEMQMPRLGVHKVLAEPSHYGFVINIPQTIKS